MLAHAVRAALEGLSPPMKCTVANNVVCIMGQVYRIVLVLHVLKLLCMALCLVPHLGV